MNTAVVRRLTWLLFFGQSLGSAAFIAGAAVSAIVGEHLSGEPALAGLPSATYLLGSALAAYPAAWLMERIGRRKGLSVGFLFGITGGLVCAFAVLFSSFVGFLAGMLAMGVTRGVTDLGRYAAAEMHPASQRARAISTVVLGGTFGAILGPALVAPMGRLAVNFSADALAGPWFAAAGLFLLGLLLLWFFLRPDPSDLARQLASADAASPGAAPALSARPWREILGQTDTRVAVAAMVVGQLVMVMLMTITSLHMIHYGHGLGDVSLVIMAHTLGMFGLSMVTGRLTDNFGRAPVIVTGGVILIAACLLAPLSQRTELLALALFLLGLGWNFCAVAGAALLTDSLNLSERARLQGINDLAVGAVSAVGSLQSGALFAIIGFTNLSWISLVVSLVPLLLAARLVVLARARTRVAQPG